jgi:(R)-2-hydroxyacyl-CoA dehydratese activating ATPase
MITAGVDAGSRMIKAVIWDARNRRLLGTAAADQGVDQGTLARRVYESALAEAGLPASKVEGVIATGYGRDNVAFARSTVTEITCHARSVRENHPGVRTVVDIGGQDSKVIRLDADGKVRDFVMNDRCAAGTGRFLEVVAQRLGVAVEALGPLAGRSRSPVAIASMCVVFAETEIIGLLAQRAKPADIAAGVQVSICTRVAAMAGNKALEPVVMTGGVALIPGMKERLAEILGVKIRVALNPRFTGAWGAAMLASEAAWS